MSRNLPRRLHGHSPTMLNKDLRRKYEGNCPEGSRSIFLYVLNKDLITTYEGAGPGDSRAIWGLDKEILIDPGILIHAQVFLWFPVARWLAG